MHIDDQPDVTGAMKKLTEGQSQSREEAAKVVWAYSYVRLVAMARAMLRNAPRGARDEEDLALNTLNSICAGAAAGRFSDLTSRDNFWRVLYTITVRKARAAKDYGRSKKRDARRVADFEVDQLACSEPTPELAASLVDERAAMIQCLRDETLRQIAELHLDGYNALEIAIKLGVSDRTVQRKLELIRKAWQLEIDLPSRFTRRSERGTMPSAKSGQRSQRHEQG
jgi:DNA-directed RNA polymerase specialized sigma24 family protein